MDTPRFSSEQGALRFAVDGRWSADDLANFLRDTSEVYDRVNSVYVLREAIDFEARINTAARERNDYDQQVFDWHSELFGHSIHHPMGFIRSAPPSYDRVLELTRSVSLTLTVDAIAFASPGWIQMIGDWNPLKVLADFISKWRAENTKRDANRLKAENERLRIRSELAAKLLEAAPKMERHHEGGAARLIDMAENVIQPAAGYIARVGADSRIIDVEAVSPGAPLPVPGLGERGLTSR